MLYTMDLEEILAKRFVASVRWKMDLFEKECVSDAEIDRTPTSIWNRFRNVVISDLAQKWDD
jgi:hypothetical protein